MILFHFVCLTSSPDKAPDAVYLASKPLIVGMGELHQICDKNSGETVRIQSNIFHVFSDCYKQRKNVYLNWSWYQFSCLIVCFVTQCYSTNFSNKRKVMSSSCFSILLQEILMLLWLPIMTRQQLFGVEEASNKIMINI